MSQRKTDGPSSKSSTTETQERQIRKAERIATDTRGDPNTRAVAAAMIMKLRRVTARVEPITNAAHCESAGRAAGTKTNHRTLSPHRISKSCHVLSAQVLSQQDHSPRKPGAFCPFTPGLLFATLGAWPTNKSRYDFPSWSK